MEDLNEFYLMHEIGRRIALWRREARMSQDDLAAAVGVVRCSITNLEAGRQKSPVTLLYRCAVALKHCPKDLFPTVEEIQSPHSVKVKVAGREVEVSPAVASEIERLIETSK